ncbi:hypothetical protein [Helicobacter cappadocius]|uniref:Uncharacterized protein n=1 Tax=Helicobacter cappadocius TaxID=3063998 RepID=A0AA90TFL9_9HELI|nr:MULTISPECIES: hypothetical protein [unclassified Helicobacter]MDO7253923.1 hypothetical protein [Helicobacter sp. faydin-H75]MDP2539780.1 hypothetical protein [Helicobacter sp. faydin-H76]
MEFKKNKPKPSKVEEIGNLQKINSIDELSARFEQKLSTKPSEISSEAILSNKRNNMSGQSETEKEEKKNYTVSLSKKVISELEEFLEDFGEFGETKSSFIQNAIIESIEKRKFLMKEKLLNKIKKLESK